MPERNILRARRMSASETREVRSSDGRPTGVVPAVEADADADADAVAVGGGRS
jgi:hypothetical protein